MQQTKEVYFEQYCPKCENEKTKETELPCDECLSQVFNTDSHKPIRFKEKK